MIERDRKGQNDQVRARVRRSAEDPSLLYLKRVVSDTFLLLPSLLSPIPRVQKRHPPTKTN